MDARLKDALENKTDNYILPFLWMSGQDEAALKEMIGKIQEAGMGAFCLESRTHPEFMEDGWWRDLDIIMDEAKERNMRVWLLDDAHFPTGYANGWIKDKYPEKGKIYLACRHIDAIGPQKNASFLLNERIFDIKAGFGAENKILCVAAAKKDEGRDSFGEAVNLDSNVREGILSWDVPEGVWRVFILYTTRGGGNPDYINVIDRSSVRVLLDAVYEPHYRRYKDEFGKTFAGFFSDEPGMGNVEGYDFEASIGRRKMPLPWCGQAKSELEKKLGADFFEKLAALWYDMGEGTSLIRYEYMDVVTRLYEENFSNQLGDWCRGHNVEYIGHVIEDENVHARLGCGAGHFFRALGGQDMSGVDVVLQQIMPGFDEMSHEHINGTWNGEFFHYALAKMASSLGHIDPLKKGRTVCEIYGAYGWSEGLKQMKWLLDHMLVRGVNWLVPHAFSGKPFPDFDCPPHFYALGNNPQYRHMKPLMEYANRMCHLLNGGRHMAPVAVIYHAQAEWAGEYQPFQKAAKVLLQSQIDFDVLPVDVFEKRDKFRTAIEQNLLSVNGEHYRAVIIPYTQKICRPLAKFLEEAQSSGIEIVFTGGQPRETVGGRLPDYSTATALKLSQLADFLKEKRINEIETDGYNPYLRYYHYKRKETEIYMFFNEHPYSHLETKVKLPFAEKIYLYDALSNYLSPVKTTSDGNAAEVGLCLSAYESAIFIAGELPPEYICREHMQPFEIDRKAKLSAKNGWAVSFCTAQEYPCFKDTVQMEKLKDITAHDMYPGFAGTIRYETEFTSDGNGFDAIEIDDVYETAEVWINGEYAGLRLCPPYRFDAKDLAVAGINKLRIEVTNTLAHKTRDIFSASHMLEPSGMLGPVWLIKQRQ